MRVLLVRPPATFVRGSLAEELEIPLGLMYLGAACERAGHEVEIYDGAVQYDVESMNAAGDEAVHVGASWEPVRERFCAKPYDVIGISNPFFTQYPGAQRAAGIAREVRPDATVLMGGPHPTVEPAMVLAETPAVDVIVRGEAEAVIGPLLAALHDGRALDEVKGIAFRRNGEVVLTDRQTWIRDLDALGRPAYHLIDVEDYMRQVRLDHDGRWIAVPHRIITMLTSRGCPYECCFCSVHLHMGRLYRRHSAAFVIDHARYVVEELGIRHIYFVDDNMAQDRRRFEDILDGFICLKDEGKGFAWETPNGMRTDRLTYDILKKCRDAGCRSIVLTVESGSQRVLDEIIRKKLDLDKVVEVAGWCRELAIKARAGFIVGLPGETLADMEKTVEFAHMLRRRFGIKGHLSTATPYYGTPMHATCLERGYITDAMTPDRLAVAVQGEGMIATEDFTVEDVKAVRAKFERRGGLFRKIGKRIERTVKKIARGQ